MRSSIYQLLFASEVFCDWFDSQDEEYHQDNKLVKKSPDRKITYHLVKDKSCHNSTDMSARKINKSERVKSAYT